ncbi:MAG: hypothetical protein ACFCU8_09170 [Thermosynechococcaceae cyanobacterium]
MKKFILALTTTLATALTLVAPQAIAQQIVFGSSVESTPFNSFFLPNISTSASDNFYPPTGFYHYFWLPRYTAAYDKLYSNFEYDIPADENGKISYDFTIIKSFDY